uniref:uncharacterized protein LOC122770124 isoform X2 n=1 Tax=Solea senegalensis TaxID=28829 RepID=UPI001CD90017|nr:uncharacterized protein LOC122770124 isoform X2 [Solea senegalensis]
MSLLRLTTTMSVVAVLVLLVHVQLSCSCDAEQRSLICHSIPSYFSPGYLTLVMYVNDVGNINSTLFHSEGLASVTRLRLDGADITGIDEGAFGSLQNLTSVSLMRNSLTQVNSNWFARPAVLSELSLSENQIEAVNESMLGGFTGLTKLSLSKNRIRTIGPHSLASQSSLAELDLSENRLTRLSPQVLGPLRSTKIRLDANPWDCSCAAQDSVLLIKGLHSRSQLDRESLVTCVTPSALNGRPVWNVTTACETSPEPGSTSVSQSVNVKPTSALTPAASEKVETTQSQPTTERSVQTTPTDGAVQTSHTGNTSFSEAETATRVTSTPSHNGASGSCETSHAVQTILSALIAVIVILCVLLFVVCFLLVQHRRKHINAAAVTPGKPANEKSEQESGTTRDRSPLEPPDSRDPELLLRRTLTGVRAKSADAVLFTSPFAASGSDRVAEQTETEQEEHADGHRVESEGIWGQHFTNITETNEMQTDADMKIQGNSHCVDTDTVPYLSMSTNQITPHLENLSRESTDSSGQRSQMGKILGRISTWPLTAAQWQQQCQIKEEEEGNEAEKFPGQGEETVKRVEHQDKTAEKEKTNQKEDSVHFSNQDHKTASHCEVVKQEDLTAARSTRRKTPNRDVKPAENSTHQSRHDRREQRNEEAAETSKAPPGGASPDDDTLLDGNEYAFMDLLHEVAQNRGRWTRDRWRHVHANKQRKTEVQTVTD